ncbi:MAG: rhodanese-like domain-containing protein [Rhodospirillaceae bacterium]|nr:rhodanese-like domain-containing protein [Rhodospirillaceae bacterium]
MPLLNPVRLLPLFLVIFGSLVLVLWTGSGVRAAENIISAPDARAAALAGSVIIIDVRSPREWRQTGVPSGARTVTTHNRNGIKAFIAQMAKAVGGDKSKPIALICAAGARSARALKILTAAGFTKIQNVSEGMLGRPDAGPGWLKRGLPVTQPASLR